MVCNFIEADLRVRLRFWTNGIPQKKPAVTKMFVNVYSKTVDSIYIYIYIYIYIICYEILHILTMCIRNGQLSNTHFWQRSPRDFSFRPTHSLLPDSSSWLVKLCQLSSSLLGLAFSLLTDLRPRLCTCFTDVVFDFEAAFSCSRMRISGLAAFDSILRFELGVHGSATPRNIFEGVIKISSRAFVAFVLAALCRGVFLCTTTDSGGSDMMFSHDMNSASQNALSRFDVPSDISASVSLSIAEPREFSRTVRFLQYCCSDLVCWRFCSKRTGPPAKYLSDAKKFMQRLSCNSELSAEGPLLVLESCSIIQLQSNYC